MPHTKELTRAEKAIEFIHGTCIIPEGKYVGQKLILEEFQQDFFRLIFDQEVSVKQAIWSMARKNAKTTTIACLVLVFLVGPEAIQNSQIVSGAMSKDQAALVFNTCCKIIRMNPELENRIQIKEGVKELVGLGVNTQYRALSAEAKTKHGLSPLVVIFDELGQVVGPRDDFYEALETAQGAYDNPLFIIISTQSANDTDLLSILIDDALEGKDPSTVCLLHAAPDGCDLLDESAWSAANPAMGTFRSYEDIKKQANAALRMPSKEPAFRNLILNQRVTATNPFITRETWRRCGGEVNVKPEDCEELYGGLDLSARTDLTAFILLGRIGENWYAFCYFWTPEKGLHERAARDRAPYDVWHNQGFLLTTPGATVDYEYVAKEIGEITAGTNLKGIAFDRWRIDVFKKEMENIGLDLPMVEWGQGFKDMAPALDAIEEVILNENLIHGNHPVLTMCAASAVVTKDPSGNRKLDKSKTSARIDGMVAAAMAMGLAARDNTDPIDLDDFLNNPVIA
jgi:phage terminase large subunit-like protein